MLKCVNFYSFVQHLSTWTFTPEFILLYFKVAEIGFYSAHDLVLMGSWKEIVTLRNVCPCDCNNPKSSISKSGAIAYDQQCNCEVGREVSTWTRL